MLKKKKMVAGRGMVVPKIEPILLTKKQAEEERKRSNNLGWPYSPAISEVFPKKRKQQE